MEGPKVLISIVNWMNYWDAIACVKLCKEQSYKNIKIIVVDNASVNESVKSISDAHPDIVVVKSKKNLGFAGGHNISYQYALKNNYDAIWLLNPDVRIFPDTLVNLVNAYMQRGTAIYGSITVDEKNRFVSGGGNKVNNDFSIDMSIDINKILANKDINDISNCIYKTSYVTGSSFFMPMDIPRHIGFLRKDFFMYAEEVDYCFRAIMNKYYCYLVCNSLIIHNAARSFALSERLEYVKNYYVERNYLLFALKNKIVSRRKIIKDNLGLFSIMRRIVNKNKTQEYYRSLAIIHSLLSIRGRYFNPEKYL